MNLCPKLGTQLKILNSNVYWVGLQLEEEIGAGEGILKPGPVLKQLAQLSLHIVIHIYCWFLEPTLVVVLLAKFNLTTSCQAQTAWKYDSRRCLLTDKKGKLTYMSPIRASPRVPNIFFPKP